MNRLELPAPPGPQTYFPFPPPPRMASNPPPPRRGRQKLLTLVLGLAMILLAGVAGVVASDTSKSASGPFLGGERSHAFIGRTATGRPYRWDPCSAIHYQIDPGRVGDRIVDDASQFVSGVVVINASAQLEEGFGRAPSVGTVAQHELGHAVGLAHILDPFQLMSPMPVVVDWGRGDRKGLQELGEGPCLHVPTAELHAAIVPLA